jgi:plasmid maintenance system antidote protein VapI
MDIDRLNEWLAQKKLTLYKLSKILGVPSNTLYKMAKRGRVSDQFIVRFIQVYGCEEALTVFPIHLTKSTTSS